jgi:hypothetical protein
MTLRRSLTLAVGIGVLALSGSAGAFEIYMNGVKVSGLKGQTFQGCTVRFDENGHVHITAPGYKVERVDDGGKSTPPKSGSKYFLVSWPSKPQGYAQYDVDVYINGKWLRKIRNHEGQVIQEISRQISPGKVVVYFAATKSSDKRLSSAAAHQTRVIIGTGTAGGGTVNITTTLAEFTVSADKTANFGREVTFTAP